MASFRIGWIVAGVMASCAIALAACDGGGANGDDTPQPDGTPVGEVTVLGIWEDEEYASFQAMVDGWPGRMDFTGTRDITDILRTRVEGGNPPDVAIPAEIGLFQQFAREGRLTPLSACQGLEETIRANYPAPFVELGTVDGTLYGFFMKADTKATIWYDPEFFSQNGLQALTEDATFEDLIALSDGIAGLGTPPWSMGQEAGGSSGFPGSDMIQQIILNEYGVDVYDQIVRGEIPMTDDRVRDAWEKFGQIALTDGYTVQGGGPGIVATEFMDSSYPPFQQPPAAAMVHLGGFAAGFIADQFPDAQPGTDYDFMPWPGGAVTGSANIAYAFNSDPATCSFLSHIASADAQRVWVERRGFTSLNSDVDLSAYADDVARRQARQLLQAETFRFDLDDAIGGSVQQAIFRGVLQYLTNPGSLDSILQNIEAARGGG